MATVRKRTWQSGDTEGTAWIVSYTDQNGDRRTKQFKTKREADAYNVEAQHQVSQGTHTADSASVTVAEAAERWIRGREIDGVERATLAQYRLASCGAAAQLVGSACCSPGVALAARLFATQGEAA